ncbi:MAG: alpha-ketoacid dehydrogenase subunit beta [Phycisphaerae bacterium]|nr:alpha-ketoacid dehydrogenase subunit beta [Phycisphaerae bacterium]
MSNWGTTPKLPELIEQGTRPLSYQQAIAEAMRQALATDERVRVFGEGTTDKAGTYGTTKDLHVKFGEDRVFDVPTAEGVITGMGIGMSLGGLRPIVIHPRNDFLLLALDQIANHAAKWQLMFGNCTSTPMAIRSVACRGWGSAAQHSQALHAILAHFPGLEVAVPFTPADAKGMLLYAALQAEGPVVLMEHKWLWNLTGHVKAQTYFRQPAPPQILREGEDVTIAAISYGLADALLAAQKLAETQDIAAEVIDIRWLRPLDVAPICESVRKTGRLIVVDTGHVQYGITGEIVAQVLERITPVELKATVRRLGIPDTPVPACSESTYYPGPDDVVAAATEMCKQAATETLGS